MDVKLATFAALQTTIEQAHIAPEKGLQGDFEHWHRIFDATDRADTAERPPAGRMTESGAQSMPDRHALRQTGARPSSAQTAHADQSGQVSPGPGQSLRSPLVSDAISGRGATSLAVPSGMRISAFPVERVSAPTPSQASSSGERMPTTPDGRPLAQLEAHLSRGTDGRLSVALRSTQPLSTAQALHAVALSLTEQGRDSTSVDLILLNGQPIYRSASPAAHRFDIDC